MSEPGEWCELATGCACEGPWGRQLFIVGSSTLRRKLTVGGAVGSGYQAEGTVRTEAQRREVADVTEKGWKAGQCGPDQMCRGGGVRVGQGAGHPGPTDPR